MRKALLFAILFFAHRPMGWAIDCGAKAGQFRFICQTAPALLEAMNPTLKIPVCGQQDQNVKVQPGSLPSTAVFVTCVPENVESCSNIIEALIQKNTGATVNMIVPQNSLKKSGFVDRVSKLAAKAKGQKVPVNVIPVDHEYKPNKPDYNIYNRDPAIARTNGNKTEMVVLPAQEGESTVIAKALRQCGDVSVVEDVAKEKQQSETAEGGNFLVLPDGTILVGKSDENRRKAGQKTVSEKVKEKFGQSQKLAEIDLPGTQVGHIDEVFNIVPSKSACGISVLSASPQKMEEFLTAHKSEKVRSVFNTSGLDDKILDQRYVLETEYKSYVKSGKKPPQEFMERLHTYWTEVRRQQGIKNETGLDILQNRKLMDRWKEYQNDIETAKKQLKAHLNLPPNCKDEDLFVDVPVLWDEGGRPQVANPVNGLYLNGTYFYSRQETNLVSGMKFDPKSVSYRSTYEIKEFPALQKEVDRILRSRISADLQDVSTPDYNNPAFGSGGNLHCATLNIPIPCKPR